MAVESLKCKECGESYPLEASFVCEQCFGPLEVSYDFSGLDAGEARRKIQAGSRGIWRYSDFLPFAGRPGDPLEPGLTPLIRADRLAERLGLGELWIKNDAANPTHSFKDRVVAVAVAKAKELGFETVACASTGNLANAVAAHAAAAGLDSYVFVPADLEEQKLLATGIYGTNLVGIRGTYDDVNRLCTELSQTHPWAFVNVNLRPYYSEGSKTLAFETIEQLGWSLPDRIVAPIASGSLFTKLAKGIREWRDVGLVEGDLPTFCGAQPDGCSPVATAFAEGWDVCKPERKPDTIAKSLAIGDPADGPYALELARQTGGQIKSVSDDEIRAGIKLLAETTGVFTETAGGVTIGVLTKLAEEGAIGSDERVVAYITGEGLKTLDAARESFRMHEIEPTLNAFHEEFEGVGASA
ncbi:MAG TPA: threonine synthase [Solirubrobacterales bacterium]|nr:threonine synthase [Solirubrobacterales bacterium]